MYCLAYESPDKTKRTFFRIQNPIPHLREDNGLIEVISLHDPSKYVRIFFDIDHDTNDEDPLNKLLSHLSNLFQCNLNTWAIATCHRESRRSYHIVSTIFCIQISELRKIADRLHAIFPCVDTKVLYCAINDPYECSYFRLPNQTKFRIRKTAPPIRIETGTLEDFIITDISKLIKL